MNSYNDIAYLYDKLTMDIDYERYIIYLREIFNKYNLKPQLILDLACGTGNITIELAKCGIEMIGLDSSLSMLEVASKKALKDKQDILFINQDMCDFELYGTVDAIICTLDGINHVTDKRRLARLFKLAQNYLNINGLMIFDINTYYKLSEIIGNNVFIHDENDIYYIWENNFNKTNNICNFHISFFVKENETYKRIDESYCERAYATSELKDIIDRVHLKIEGAFDEYSFKSPKSSSERIFFVLRKVV